MNFRHSVVYGLATLRTLLAYQRGQRWAAGPAKAPSAAPRS